MFIDFLKKINSTNENIFANFDEMIESFGLSDWLCDAIIDSFHILPLLFIIFVLIEIIEFFWADKINLFMKKSEKSAPLIGSLAAIIPQCGFSVIASTLYIRRFITKGTLLAIFLATSDEAIPILLSYPQQYHYIIPIISLKLFIAIFAGFLIDYILKGNKYIPVALETEDNKGCCHHDVTEIKIFELFYHPLKHTFNIFVFILLITILLNFAIDLLSNNSNLHLLMGKTKFFETTVAAFVGLIPNCAVSITLTMLLIKGSLSFGAVMAGLLSNAGLGILVLFRNNKNIKDSLLIIFILLTISIFAGYLIQILIGC